jgi:hypothetical protein
MMEGSTLFRSPGYLPSPALSGAGRVAAERCRIEILICIMMLQYVVVRSVSVAYLAMVNEVRHTFFYTAHICGIILSRHTCMREEGFYSLDRLDLIFLTQRSLNLKFLLLSCSFPFS